MTKQQPCRAMQFIQPEEVSGFEAADEHFKSIMKVRYKYATESQKAVKVPCMRKGINFMNRCGVGSRHKTILRDGKLFFTNHDSVEEMRATAAAASLAAAGREENTNVGETASCGTVQKNWSRGYYKRLPLPMQPYYLHLCADDIIIVGRRLLRQVQRRLPKKLRFKHDPKASFLPTGFATRYVVHQLQKLGFYDIDTRYKGREHVDPSNGIKHKAYNDEIRSVNGTTVDFELRSGNCERISRIYFRRCYYISDRDTETYCMDCAIEEMAAYVLGTIVAKTYDIRNKQVTDALYERTLAKLEPYMDTMEIVAASALHTKPGDRLRPIVSENRFAWADEKTSRAVRSEHIRNDTNNSIRFTMALPVGNSGLQDFVIKKLLDLKHLIQTVHPEARLGESYERPKLEETVPAVDHEPPEPPRFATRYHQGPPRPATRQGNT